MGEHDLSAGGDVMDRVRACARDALRAYDGHPQASVELLNVSENATFLVTDESGSIPAGAEGDYGLYAADTRFVSRHELRLNGRRPDSAALVAGRVVVRVARHVSRAHLL